MEKPYTTVSTDWLHQELQRWSAKVKVVEVTWTPGAAAHFEKSRIPSAQLVDMTKWPSTTKYHPLALQPPQALEDIMRAAGVDGDDHVLVYDREMSLYAGRFWLTTRAYGHEAVSMLDGGWHKWTLDGLPTETGEVKVPEKGTFKAGELQATKVKTFEDMIRIYKDGSEQIIDAREQEDFAGVNDEPCQNVKFGFDMMRLPAPKMLSGHIPGSISLPNTRVLDLDTHCFLADDKLRELFAENGIDASRPTVGTCYSGFWANLTICALMKLGNNQVSTYVGSWTEYAQRAAEQDVTKHSKIN